MEKTCSMKTLVENVISCASLVWSHAFNSFNYLKSVARWLFLSNIVQIQMQVNLHLRSPQNMHKKTSGDDFQDSHYFGAKDWYQFVQLDQDRQ